MKDLPRPSIDMCDGAAATFLHQLADHYDGYEARYIRAFATRLRSQHDAATQMKAEARAKRIKDLQQRLANVDDEHRELDNNEADAERELAELRRGT